MESSYVHSAQHIRDFLSMHTGATLSTVRTDGYPYGSFVYYDVDNAGSPILFLSSLSDHCRNIIKNEKVSLLVYSYQGSNPLTNLRITLVGDCTEIDPLSLPAVKESYTIRFPNSSLYQSFQDFSYFKLVPEKIRWIGGFGDMGWFRSSGFAETQHDAISYVGESIRNDFEDERKNYPLHKRLAVDFVSSRGVTLRWVDKAQNNKSEWHEFDKPLSTREDVLSMIRTLADNIGTDINN